VVGDDHQRRGAGGQFGWGEGYSQACHTAPCQVLVAGHYPWTLARSVALKREFVTCFGDIYVMPAR